MRFRLLLTLLLVVPRLAAAAEGAGDPGAVPPLWRPPVHPPVPDVADAGWARTPVDRFILARLGEAGFRPSPVAGPQVLFRRLALDLTGLPPTPEEWAEWEADPSDAAWERWIERRLASPAFGERWGRHWLDLARYADSDGYEKDTVRPRAFTYRDWVVDALNRDLPFDRFTRDQLAGDLVPGTDPAATGFHRQTLTNKEGGVDPEEDRVKQTVDRVNTTATAWMGMTLGCAECHDHKYEPITQRDYFRFYAFFNSLEEREADGGVPAVGERAEPRVTRVHRRGDFLQPGAEVEPGTPAVLPSESRPAGRPGRLDLADWLCHPDNPLVARVEANRVWQHLFGEGLVRTPDDFGARGEPPTHPELLDWLATELIRSGWSRKHLIRLVVRSATYRQASVHRADLARRDPSNRLWGRQNRVRLEAEVIRDSALSAAGLLERRIGGPGVRPPLPGDITEVAYAGVVRWPESGGADRYRRGLYTFLQRTVLYPGLTVFDAPETVAACTRRERSNTPLQALTLLNDPVFVEAAAALAARARGGGADDPGSVTGRMFRLALGRRPDRAEAERLRVLWDAAARGPVEAIPPSVACARVVLNLEEFLTRE